MYIIEPVREKTNNLGSDQVQHKPGYNYPFSENKGAELICVFVFAYADCWFFHAAAQFVNKNN